MLCLSVHKLQGKCHNNRFQVTSIKLVVCHDTERRHSEALICGYAGSQISAWQRRPITEWQMLSRAHASLCLSPIERIHRALPLSCPHVFFAEHFVQRHREHKRRGRISPSAAQKQYVAQRRGDKWRKSSTFFGHKAKRCKALIWDSLHLRKFLSRLRKILKKKFQILMESWTKGKTKDERKSSKFFLAVQPQGWEETKPKKRQKKKKKREPCLSELDFARTMMEQSARLSSFDANFPPAGLWENSAAYQGCHWVTEC